MRKKEDHLEKEMMEVSMQNRRLADPLQKAREEMNEMQKKLGNHERDKQILVVSVCRTHPWLWREGPSAHLLLRPRARREAPHAVLWGCSPCAVRGVPATRPVRLGHACPRACSFWLLFLALPPLEGLRYDYVATRMLSAFCPHPLFSPVHKSTFESHGEGAQGPAVGARGAGATVHPGEWPAGRAPAAEGPSLVPACLLHAGLGFWVRKWEAPLPAPLPSRGRGLWHVL